MSTSLRSVLLQAERDAAGSNATTTTTTAVRDTAKDGDTTGGFRRPLPTASRAGTSATTMPLISAVNGGRVQASALHAQQQHSQQQHSQLPRQRNVLQPLSVSALSVAPSTAQGSQNRSANARRGLILPGATSATSAVTKGSASASRIALPGLNTSTLAARKATVAAATRPPIAPKANSITAPPAPPPNADDAQFREKVARYKTWLKSTHFYLDIYDDAELDFAGRVMKKLGAKVEARFDVLKVHCLVTSYTDKRYASALNSGRQSPSPMPTGNSRSPQASWGSTQMTLEQKRVKLVWKQKMIHSANVMQRARDKNMRVVSVEQLFTMFAKYFNLHIGDPVCPPENASGRNLHKALLQERITGRGQRSKYHEFRQNYVMIEDKREVHRPIFKEFNEKQSESMWINADPVTFGGCPFYHPTPHADRPAIAASLTCVVPDNMLAEQDRMLREKRDMTLRLLQRSHADIRAFWESKRQAKQQAAGDSKAGAAPVVEKKPGFCECCLAKYSDLDGHVDTAQHQSFANTDSHFKDLDLLIAQLQRQPRTFMENTVETMIHDENGQPLHGSDSTELHLSTFEFVVDEKGDEFFVVAAKDCPEKDEDECRVETTAEAIVDLRVVEATVKAIHETVDKEAEADDATVPIQEAAVAANGNSDEGKYAHSPDSAHVNRVSENGGSDALVNDADGTAQFQSQIGVAEVPESAAQIADDGVTHSSTTKALCHSPLMNTDVKKVDDATTPILTDMVKNRESKRRRLTHSDDNDDNPFAMGIAGQPLALIGTPSGKITAPAEGMVLTPKMIIVDDGAQLHSGEVDHALYSAEQQKWLTPKRLAASLPIHDATPTLVRRTSMRVGMSRNAPSTNTNGNAGVPVENRRHTRSSHQIASLRIEFGGTCVELEDMGDRLPTPKMQTSQDARNATHTLLPARATVAERVKRRRKSSLLRAGVRVSDLEDGFDYRNDEDGTFKG